MDDKALEKAAEQFKREHDYAVKSVHAFRRSGESFEERYAEIMLSGMYTEQLMYFIKLIPDRLREIEKETTRLIGQSTDEQRKVRAFLEVL